jgi:hypothetical protein
MDALDVADGQRVVRAILAHFAPSMFTTMFPDLDLDEYLAGYRALPNSTPPIDRRRPDNGNETNSHRRWDDYYT